MNERKHALIAILEQNYEAFDALLEQLTDEDLKRRTVTGWTVAQTAGHVTDLPYGLYVAKRLARGESVKMPSFLSHFIDISNWWTVRRFRTWSKADLSNAWADAHTRVVRFVGELPDEALDRGGEVDGYDGWLTTYQFLALAPEHVAKHAPAIRQAIGLPPGP